MGERRAARALDALIVPLRLYLWLLVPALVGAGTGVALSHRSSESAGFSAAAPVVVVRSSSPAAVRPGRVYRNARTRIELASWRPGLHPLAVDPGSAVTTTSAPSDLLDGHVVAFNAEPRSFAEAVSGEPGAAPPTGTAPTTTAPAPPPVPTTPIEISDVHTVSLSAFSATIAWRTSEPVSSSISYGLDSATLWTDADAPSQSHSAIVGGLAAGTSYRLWVNAHAADGRTATSPFVLTTPPLAQQPSSSIANSTFMLDGQPSFPTMVWGACQDSYASLLADGIDLFMGKGCGNGSRQLASLGTHGYFVGDAFDSPTPGAVGTFLPDEWDTFLPNTLTSADVQRMAPNHGGGPRFLTLTNHFFSKADPLPQGRGMYPALIANADVIGFDLYPLQNWCRFDDFPVVFDAQRELVALAPGKPTFQWIEVRHMDCRDPALDPTPQTVRAETWLAIAGGAHAIGYFPKDFSPEIGAEIARDKQEIRSLLPALVEPAIEASASGSTVRVGARQRGGAVYVIAVNASRAPATATITVPALGNRPLVSLDGSRSVTAANGAFTDNFAPLDVHIYIAAPTAP
jgi:hypothetical protein